MNQPNSWSPATGIWTFVLSFALVLAGTASPTWGEIKLIVRGDDLASSHAANQACLKSFREGIVRSVEVMVPCPWFNEAAKILRDNPALDTGIHLTLTSEWENCKWGPLTLVPSLVDQAGKFFPMTNQRPDFPPNTGFLESAWTLSDVEKELRAQIEFARSRLPSLTHLSAHMGTVESRPELHSLVSRLAEEYKLPINFPELQEAPGFGTASQTAAQKEKALIRILQDLQAGTWLFIDHPGMDTPEMRALGHQGYWNVAEDRDGVTHAFTSPRVKKVIEQRNIQLISYKDLIRLH